MSEYFRLIEERPATGAWRYEISGARWMPISDWVFWRVEGRDYDIASRPLFTCHARAMEQRPVVIRALDREVAATRQLAAERMIFTPPSAS